MCSRTPPITLAEAFAATFGGPIPRRCVHCEALTTEEANYFSEGFGSVGPFAWSEPAHAACVERMAAEAEAYAARAESRG